MPPRSLTVCSQPGCPALTDAGRCTQHARAADQARGTAAQRGYTSPAYRAARAVVLRRDKTCTVCQTAPSTVSDHWPNSRRELLDLGVADPDAPHRMRGLCARCHNIATARDQPGGWNRRD